MEKKRGCFITFEGPDGCGKTTQLQLTAAYLQKQGREVLCTREPGGVLAAEEIRRILLNPQIPLQPRAEALLYLAARSEHVAEKIKPALAAGKIVLCDRFTDSTLVYQGFVRGLAMEELQHLGTWAADGLTPDLTLLLDAPPSKLLLRRRIRGVKDRFENEGLAFQEKVRAGFLVLAHKEPERFRVIDALREPQTVLKDILALLKVD